MEHKGGGDLTKPFTCTQITKNYSAATLPVISTLLSEVGVLMPNEVVK